MGKREGCGWFANICAIQVAFSSFCQGKALMLAASLDPRTAKPHLTF